MWIYNEKKLTIILYDRGNTLTTNIIKTFNECLLLLKDKTQKTVILEKKEKEIDEINKQNLISQKNLRSYYKEYHDYKYYIIRETNYGISLSGILLRLLDDHSTDDWYN